MSGKEARARSGEPGAQGEHPAVRIRLRSEEDGIPRDGEPCPGTAVQAVVVPVGYGPQRAFRPDTLTVGEPAGTDGGLHAPADRLAVDPGVPEREPPAASDGDRGFADHAGQDAFARFEFRGRRHAHADEADQAEQKKQGEPRAPAEDEKHG